MPSLNVPVLELDTSKISFVNTRNVESLYSLWTVFNKCAGSIEGGKGRRLENCAWRIWSKELFCCEPQPQLAITPSIDIPSKRPHVKDVPELSASVDSAISDDSDDTQCAATSKPQSIPHSSTSFEDSALSKSRGKEKHLTSLGLKKMVVSIQERTDIEPLSPMLAASLPKVAEEIDDGAKSEDLRNSTDSTFSAASTKTDTTSAAGSSAKQSDHRGSDTSVSSDGLIRSGSVVHGFSPSQIPASFRAKSRLGHNLPVPVSKPSSQLVANRTGVFTLGGSSGDDESSFEERMSFRPQRSSLSECLKRPTQSQKRPSYRDIVQAHQQEKGDSDQDEDAIASDEEDEEDEDVTTDSAIEDDEDEAEWEDDPSIDGRLAQDDTTLFRRVDSRAGLVSRRSMLTLALAHPNRGAGPSNVASRSSPAIHRSRRTSPSDGAMQGTPPENEDEGGLTMRAPEAARPRPIIKTTTNTHAPAHSPRTTRRNMLATELTESLRRNLLWERQQKNTTANAVFKRRHTAQNMANLKEYPEPKVDQETSKNSSWNHYYDAPWEYNSKGW